MRISAKSDYAVRAGIELAVSDQDAAIKIEQIARSQDIPRKFLESILNDMRRAGLVVSVRGARGGYRLARPSADISVADIIRSVDGPLVSVRGERPTDLAYSGAAAPLLPLWIAVRANVRAVLEEVSLADLAAGRLGARVRRLARGGDAWDNP